LETFGGGPSGGGGKGYGGGGGSGPPAKGFVVRDAPWSQPENFSNNADDFPDLGSSGAAASKPVGSVWSAKRK